MGEVTEVHLVTRKSVEEGPGGLGLGGGGRGACRRDRMAGPESGLFFPICNAQQLARTLAAASHAVYIHEGPAGSAGDNLNLKPGVSESPLFSVENGRCMRLGIPLPVGLSNTQRVIDAARSHNYRTTNSGLG
jgi:hypothetical protein